MMKRRFITAILLLMISVLIRAEDYKIYHARTGELLSLEQLAEQCSSYDVIFWGEFHENPILHQLEYQFLRMISAANSQIAVSMEMFERDVQHLLDAYLKGEIDESEFTEKSRPWPNYSSDYRPLIEFAKKHQIKVIAANIPRRYAAMVSREGMDVLKDLPVEERQLIASEIVILKDEYYENFLATMKMNQGAEGGMPVHLMDLDNLYAAQCSKDDTMAEAIFNFIQEHPEIMIIHFNGDFHSKYRLGTTQKLQLLAPELNLAVITPIISSLSKTVVIPGEYYHTGDFIILLDPDSDGQKEDN